MAKPKKLKVERKSGLAGMDQEAATKAMENWLRMVDKPLGIKEGDKRRQRKKRRGTKRRGK